MSGRVLFCGSRNWPAFDGDTIKEAIEALPAGTTVVHGGAPGADMWAGFWADRTPGLTVEVHRADWGKHGKAAGPIRNREMLDTGPSLVIAFKTGKRSRGTDDTLAEARRRGIPTEEIVRTPDA